jgi:hypothetical protein
MGKKFVECIDGLSADVKDCCMQSTDGSTWHNFEEHQRSATDVIEKTPIGFVNLSAIQVKYAFGGSWKVLVHIIVDEVIMVIDAYPQTHNIPPFQSRKVLGGCSPGWLFTFVKRTERRLLDEGDSLVKYSGGTWSLFAPVMMFSWSSESSPNESARCDFKLA